MKIQHIAAILLSASWSAAQSTPPSTRTKTTNVSADSSAILAADDGCRAGHSMLLSIAQRPAAPADPLKKLISTAVWENVGFYQACRATASHLDESKLCSELGGMPESARECREIAGFTNMVWAEFRGGDAQAACLRYTLRGESDARGGGKRASRAFHEKRCGVLVAALKEGRGASVCNELLSKNLIPQRSAVQCPLWLSYWAGSARVCEERLPVALRSSCRMKAEFLSAVQSRNTADCLASPLCTAMSGSAVGSCSPYLSSAEKNFCAEVAHAADAIRRQFKKKQPMNNIGPALQKTMKAIDKKKSP